MESLTFGGCCRVMTVQFNGGSPSTGTVLKVRDGKSLKSDHVMAVVKKG